MVPRHTRLFDVKSRVFSDTNSTSSEKLAGMLDAQRYLSVPVYYRHQAVGRLYIIDGPNRIDSADMDFMLQLMDHVTPVMENIRLIDNLASDAAEQERQRIAHDIHDSVIQPYLGLQFGLAALDQKLEAGQHGYSRKRAGVTRVNKPRARRVATFRLGTCARMKNERTCCCPRSSAMPSAFQW